MSDPAVSLPEPAAGSSRYFAWLYTPRSQRRRVQSLLGIADELAVSLRPGLEHQVAHVRLSWWQMEAERLRHGAGTHPLVRELQGGSDAPDHAHSGQELAQLVEAATLALAQALLDPAAVAPQESALFPAIAALLVGPSLDPRQRTVLAAIGARVHALETNLDPAATLAANAAVLEQQLQQLDRDRLPALAPLLVWSALALRHARRRARGRHGTSLRIGVADNLLAWRSARAAIQHQLPPLKV